MRATSSLGGLLGCLLLKAAAAEDGVYSVAFEVTSRADNSEIGLDWIVY